MVVDIPNWPSP